MHRSHARLRAWWWQGRESVVQLLLTVDANVNATANLGVTALMGAADKGTQPRATRVSFSVCAYVRG
jgi:hypothetical protein